MADSTTASPRQTAQAEHGFVRAIGLFDGTMIVVGSMIGSASLSLPRNLACDRLRGRTAAHLDPHRAADDCRRAFLWRIGRAVPARGGQYVYLREAYSPLWGFLYGWTLFLVIQTGTIAAVAIAFARYLAVSFRHLSAVLGDSAD